MRHSASMLRSGANHWQNFYPNFFECIPSSKGPYSASMWNEFAFISYFSIVHSCYICFQFKSSDGNENNSNLGHHEWENGASFSKCLAAGDSAPTYSALEFSELRSRLQESQNPFQAHHNILPSCSLQTPVAAPEQYVARKIDNLKFLSSGNTLKAKLLTRLSSISAAFQIS